MAVMASTLASVMIPMSSPYSMRSWPSSARHRRIRNAFTTLSLLRLGESRDVRYGMVVLRVSK